MAPSSTACPLAPRLPPGRPLLTLLLLFLATASGVGAQERESEWRAGLGVGMALDLAGAGQEVDALGLATHAQLTWRGSEGPGWGLQWDGAWFDGRVVREKRVLLSAVVDAPLGDIPLRLRAGPGVGLATVVETELPAPGGVGDALVSIGDNGAWGAVAGLAGRMEIGWATLDPLATLVWQRVGGHSAGAHQVVTLVLGGRLTAGG